MSDQFDAYHKWLGIPPKDQPPNHYRLLGLDKFESDREVIHAAARRTAAFIKSNGTGPHAELAAKLMEHGASPIRSCSIPPKHARRPTRG